MEIYSTIVKTTLTFFVLIVILKQIPGDTKEAKGLKENDHHRRTGSVAGVQNVTHQYGTMDRTVVSAKEGIESGYSTPFAKRWGVKPLRVRRPPLPLFLGEADDFSQDDFQAV